MQHRDHSESAESRDDEGHEVSKTEQVRTYLVHHLIEIMCNKGQQFQEGEKITSSNWFETYSNVDINAFSNKRVAKPHSAIYQVEQRKQEWHVLHTPGPNHRPLQ